MKQKVRSHVSDNLNPLTDNTTELGAVTSRDVQIDAKTYLKQKIDVR